MVDQSDTWSPGIEFILEEIRLNSIDMSNYHKDKYYYLKGYLKYFRIPTIILSAMNSVFSVGLQPYCPQPTISIICCLISLVCGVISSIELFLSIQNTMENELTSSKDFYLLSVDVFKMLSLERNTRMVNGKIYLDETYQTYCKLIENSNLITTEIKNMIAPAFQPTPKLFSMTKEQLVDIEMPESTLQKTKLIDSLPHVNLKMAQNVMNNVSNAKSMIKPLVKEEITKPEPIKIKNDSFQEEKDELSQIVEEYLHSTDDSKIEETIIEDQKEEKLIIEEPYIIIEDSPAIEEQKEEKPPIEEQTEEQTNEVEESKEEQSQSKTKRKYTKKIKS